VYILDCVLSGINRDTFIDNILKGRIEVMQLYTKTQRQLLLYEILYTSHEVMMDDLMRRLNASKKTIQRDIEDLTEAGLIKLTYSRKGKSYKHVDATGIISEPEGTARYLHLKKLRRLAIFMEELSDASNYSFGEEYNCKERYFELFPEVSERTRMRDYEILNGIGYTIRWDEYEKRHIVQGYLYQIREDF